MFMWKCLSKTGRNEKKNGQKQLAAECYLPGLCFWPGSLWSLVQLADRYYKLPKKQRISSNRTFPVKCLLTEPQHTKCFV